MVKQNTNRSRKFNDLLQFGIVAAVLILLNLLASQFVARLDLTEEKRYSISPATKKILSELEDVVYVEVYLEGEFPAGFKRLQKSTREMLEEFRRYAGSNLEYQFVDPSGAADVKARNEYYNQLAKKGIQPTNLFAMEGDKRVEKIIFPGAIVSYLEKEEPVMLLKGSSMAKADERVNQSVEGLEYELAAAIKKLGTKEKKKIGVLEGHGELSVLEIADLAISLQEHYVVERVKIQNKVNFDGYDALIIAKPTKAFSDTSKFKLDQYIINGGKVLFCIDAISATLDSIGEKGTLAMPNEHNLDDLLFRFGVRLNNDLIQDVYSAQIPMVTGYVGTQMQTNLVPWRFFPVINSFGKHPISRNMDMVYLRFAGSIDTVKATGITKTPLMFTSKYTRILPAPVRLNFNDARIDVDPALFNKGALPVGFLLEGKFKSMFTNRLVQRTIEALKFKEENLPSKLVVLSDGDFVRNDIDKKTGKPLELGYDRFMRAKLANKEFVMNALDYMMDESGLLSVRAKEITLRPLDRIRVRDEKTMWQALNLVVPVLLVLAYGLVRYYTRKKRYTHF